MNRQPGFVDLFVQLIREEFGLVLPRNSPEEPSPVLPTNDREEEMVNTAKGRQDATTSLDK